MPRPVSYIPQYRLHKPTGKAVVTIDGQDRYLGLYNSPESRREYDRLITEWIAGGRGNIDRSSNEIHVNEVMLAYLKHADQRYRDSVGNPTRELESMALAFRPLKQLYGNMRRDRSVKHLQRSPKHKDMPRRCPRGFLHYGMNALLSRE
jgi:hypothetical protein